ncbi:MAG TPA: ribosome-binding factor A, partial [Cellvibrio sp.]
VPKLQFIYDKTSVKGQALSSLIDRAIAEDRLHPQDENPSAADDKSNGE